MLGNYYCAITITPEHKVVIADERNYRIAIRRLMPGRYVLKIEQPVPQRTVAQNAYLHAGPFPILARELGDSVEGVKYDLMGEKWGWKPSAMDPTRMVPVKPSTASMTVEECTEFIEWLPAFCLQKFNVIIPLPGELLEAAS